jgi:hypothetical protein
VVSRVLLQTPELTLGEFTCASGDRLWDEVNDIGDGAHVLVTPNDVVYYRPHQRYRCGLRNARGDRSLWLEVAPALFERAPGGPAASRATVSGLARKRHNHGTDAAHGL